jgi:predicted amidohydrolase YtcJ
MWSWISMRTSRSAFAVPREGTAHTVLLAVFLSALAILWSLPAAAQQAPAPASMILHNGKILTVDGSFSTVQAVAISGNRFTAVGANVDVLRQKGPETLVIDLKNRMVVPGMMNTHIHIPGAEAQLAQSAPRAFNLDWRGVRNKQDVLSQIQGHIQKSQPKPGAWLLFRNNNLSPDFVPSPGAAPVNHQQILFDELTRYDLDKAAPDNPIILTMTVPSENLLFVNGKALDILFDKHGDFIKKYGRFWVGTNGMPDGHLEPPATRLLLSSYAPMEPPEELSQVVGRAINALSARRS